MIQHVWSKNMLEYFDKLWRRVAKLAQSMSTLAFDTLGLVDDNDYYLSLTYHLNLIRLSINNTNSYEDVCL